jgi:Bacterial Ig-like domain (group 2)
VRRWAPLLTLLAGSACSGLDEGEGGVVAIEVETPVVTTLEVGEQVQVVARALDADGQVVDVAIDWQSTSAAATIDDAGLVTGVQPGTAEVQASVGTLASEPLEFTVVARPDTIIVVGDSVIALPAVAEPPADTALTVRVESLDPAGLVGSHPVIFEITSPVPGATPVVQLAGGVQIDTITTATEGTASVTVGAVSGQVPPDTAIVQVRAERNDGSPVPGSGQRFILLFQ